MKTLPSFKLCKNLIERIHAFEINDKQTIEVTSIILMNSVNDPKQRYDLLKMYEEAINELYDYWTLNAPENDNIKNEFVKETMDVVKSIFKGTSVFNSHLSSEEDITSLGNITPDKLKVFVDLKLCKLVKVKKDTATVSIFSDPILARYDNKTKTFSLDHSIQP